MKEAILDFAQRAHEQVFRASGARRIDVDSQQAAVTVRSALADDQPLAREEAARQRARRDHHDLAVEHRRPPVPHQPVGRGPLPPGLPRSGWRCSSSRGQGARSRPGHPGRSASCSRSPARCSSASARRRPRFAGGRDQRPAAAATRWPRSSRCWSAGSSAPAWRSSSSASPSRSPRARRRRPPAPVERARAWVAREAHPSRVGASPAASALVVLAAARPTIPTTLFRTSWSGGRCSSLYVGIVSACAPAGCSSPTTRSSSCTSARSFGVFAAMIVGDRVHGHRRRRPRRRQHRPDRARTPATRAATATSSCARNRSTRSCGRRATTRCRRPRTTSSAPSTRSRSPSS